MKKELNFWRSLEEYSWQVVSRTPLFRYWREGVVGITLLVLATSFKYAKYSVVGATNTRDIVTRSTQIGDYEIAKRLWNETMSELEAAVYPERKVERKIAELEKKLELYPGNREIYLSLANLYEQLKGEWAGEPRPYGEMAAEYLEKARILDPNGVEF